MTTLLEVILHHGRPFKSAGISVIANEHLAGRDGVDGTKGHRGENVLNQWTKELGRYDSCQGSMVIFNVVLISGCYRRCLVSFVSFISVILESLLDLIDAGGQLLGGGNIVHVHLVQFVLEKGHHFVTFASGNLSQDCRFGSSLIQGATRSLSTTRRCSRCRMRIGMDRFRVRVCFRSVNILQHVFKVLRVSCLTLWIISQGRVVGRHGNISGSGLWLCLLLLLELAVGRGEFRCAFVDIHVMLKGIASSPGGSRRRALKGRCLWRLFLSSNNRSVCGSRS